MSTTYKYQFEEFYTNFQQMYLFQRMVNTTENTHWHREDNVGVHTNMVVQEYIQRSPKRWSRADYLGAIACAFHDVGKPNAEQYIQDSSGGHNTYKGHEQISARKFELFTSDNPDWLLLDPMDIAAVCWMIQHHLPYRTTKTHKLNALKTTATFFNVFDQFLRLVMSDQYGRVSDDHDLNKLSLMEWIMQFIFKSTNKECWLNIHSKPIVYMLVGASSSGKSTLTKQLLQEHGAYNVSVFNMDKCRLDWYSLDDSNNSELDRYQYAFKQSCDDPDFTKRTNSVFTDMLQTQKTVIVDNMNLTSKSRKRIFTEAANNGYHVISIVMQTPLSTLCDRNELRGDRSLPNDLLINMYSRLSYPTIATECHEIRVN